MGHMLRESEPTVQHHVKVLEWINLLQGIAPYLTVSWPIPSNWWDALNTMYLHISMLGESLLHINQFDNILTLSFSFNSISSVLLWVTVIAVLSISISIEISNTFSFIVNNMTMTQTQRQGDRLTKPVNVRTVVRWTNRVILQTVMIAGEIWCRWWWTYQF